MNAEPVMPSWVWDVIVLCLVVVPFLVVYVWAIIERWRQFRQHRNQAIDAQMRRGMREAWRRGWIRDGDQ